MFLGSQLILLGVENGWVSTRRIREIVVPDEGELTLCIRCSLNLVCRVGIVRLTGHSQAAAIGII